MERISIASCAKELALTYVVLIVFYIAVMVAAGVFPGERIRQNIRRNIETFHNEGMYPQPVFHDSFAQLDNYTDAYLFDIAYNVDPAKPFCSMMAGKFYAYENPFEGFYRDVAKEDRTGLEVCNYGRYWLGQVAFIRPLLAAVDIFNLRLTCSVLLVCLVVTCVLLCYESFGKVAAISVLVGLLSVNVVFTAFCVQFAPVFFVALAGSIFVMKSRRLSRRRQVQVFFVIGSLTAFLDLLTAPVLTLCFPLLFVVLRTHACIDDLEVRDAWKSLCLLCIAWSVGYALTWVTKWPLAASCGIELGMGKPILFYVFGLGANQDYIARTSRIHAILGVIDTCRVLRVIIPVLFVFWIWTCLRCRRVVIDGLCVLLLFVGIIPWLWFAVMAYQAHWHAWFTYRSQAVTVAAMLLIAHRLYRLPNTATMTSRTKSTWSSCQGRSK